MNSRASLVKHSLSGPFIDTGQKFDVQTRPFKSCPLSSSIRTCPAASSLLTQAIPRQVLSISAWPSPPSTARLLRGNKPGSRARAHLVCQPMRAHSYLTDLTRAVYAYMLAPSSRRRWRLHPARRSLAMDIPRLLVIRAHISTLQSSSPLLLYHPLSYPPPFRACTGRPVPRSSTISVGSFAQNRHACARSGPRPPCSGL
ncbi:hypothetical protein OF83DRAFT_343481 [Amylostereum chailletii]|nr:hypothetical protein OF83DRAFT_343481 [Amylostereum chailletii]